MKTVAWTGLLTGIAALVVAFFLLLAQVASAAEKLPACPALGSPHSAAMDAEAQGHAEFMAQSMTQGHQGFSARVGRLREVITASGYSEICAETWAWQSGASKDERWAEYVKCWKQSPGHWRTARVAHRFIGTGEAHGRNGTWYGIILAAD